MCWDCSDGQRGVNSLSQACDDFDLVYNVTYATDKTKILTQDKKQTKENKRDFIWFGNPP